MFESWLGDADAYPHHARVAAALAELSGSGVPVRFLVGNRDFLLGEDYARRAGMELLVEPVLLDLHGTPTVLLHGDVLCTDDAEYQAFRVMVRDADWQKNFLSRPLDERRMMAAQARERSRSRGLTLDEDIMDVNADAVAQAFRTHAVPRMIHGHTHRPHIHRIEVDGKPCERIVLGDWYEQGSVLRVDAHGVELATLPLPGR